MARQRNKQFSKKVRLATKQFDWTEIGQLEQSQTALAVTARTHAAAVALGSGKAAVFEFPEEANGGLFRFETTADADAHVVEMYVGAYDTANPELCQLSRVATLTLTGGTQTGTQSNVFVRTLAISNEKWLKTLVAKSYADGSDDIAELFFDLLGSAVIVFVASTFEANADLYIYYRGV